MFETHLLVIDDEPFMLKILSRQLIGLGYSNVISLESAEEALALLTVNPLSISTILCDLDMPGMDGIEFIRHLVGTGFAGGIILVSGENQRVLQSAERLARAHKLNVLGTLSKPIQQMCLAEMLNHPDFGVSRLSRREGEKRGLDNEKRLRQGLDRQEFVNYYQPQITVLDGKLVGVEALVRWQHPEEGMVFPDNFIGLMEEFDLIDQLTGMVLQNGLECLKIWEAQGLTVNLAVNISMASMTDLNFPDFIAAATRASSFPLSRLILEVTESRLMKDRTAALDILTRLRLKRIGLSIDDFGTGHSSLAQLRDIPFGELKIDRGFTHGASTDASLESIFHASLTMARELGMSVVAEGVEDETDWRFLEHTGCDYAQGYFIGKPMPAEELFEWHEDWKARYSVLTSH